MARTPKERFVATPPLFTVFKPAGIAGENLKNVTLELDEYEAVRLADYVGMEHEEASKAMGISRSTFTRLVERARKKVASLLVEGVKLTLEGGSIHFKENLYQCCDCHRFFTLDMKSEAPSCSYCHSHQVINYAQKFGHGLCCIKGSKQ